MKLQLNYMKILKAAAAVLYRFRTLLIIMIIIGLVGYAGYLGDRMINLQPDQTYLSTQRQKLGQTKINFDKPTIQTINNLKQINPTVNLNDIGKSDPFSP